MKELGERLGEIKTFLHFEKILEKAQLKISVWGGRRVTVEEYSGSVRIADLITEVYRLINENPNYSLEERTHGQKIAEHIDQLYFKAEHIGEEAIDFRLKYACYFLTVLTDTPFVEGGIMATWDCGDRKLFNYFTKEQWESTYGTPLPAPRKKVRTGRWELYDPEEQMTYLNAHKARL